MALTLGVVCGSLVSDLSGAGATTRVSSDIASRPDSAGHVARCGVGGHREGGCCATSRRRDGGWIESAGRACGEPGDGEVDGA